MDHRPFKPSIDWSAATMDSLRWLAIAWVISAVLRCSRAGVVQVFDRLGPAVLADHRRLLRRRPHAVRVWLMLGCAVADGPDLGASRPCCSATSDNDMYSSLQTAFEGIAMGNANVKQSGDAWLLDVAGAFQRAGSRIHRRDPARHLSDSAIHHRLAHVADQAASPTTGWTARPTTGICSSTTPSTTPTSASSRTSTSSPPVSAALRTSRPTVPRTSCCSVAVHAVASVISFAAILWILSGTDCLACCRARCSGSCWSMC